MTPRAKAPSRTGKGAAPTITPPDHAEAPAGPPNVTTATLRADLPLGEQLLIPVTRLVQHPANLRGDPGDLAGLAASIERVGVLHPLLVLPDGTVVCGNRRHLAAIEAGLEAVPACVKPMTEAEQYEAMLVENGQRDDLTAVEEANGYQLLMTLGGIDEAEVAKRVGRKKARVSDRLLLLLLPEVIRQRVHDGEITLADAQHLVRLVGHPERLIEAAKGDGWNGIAGAVERELRDLEREEKRQKVLAAQRRKKGLTVHEFPSAAGYYWSPPGCERLKSWGRLGHVDEKAHAKLACHAVGVTWRGEVVPLCTSPKNHPAPPGSRGGGKDSVEAVRRQAFRPRQQERADAFGKVLQAVVKHKADEVVVASVKSQLRGDRAEATATAALLGLNVEKKASIQQLWAQIGAEVRDGKTALSVLVALELGKGEAYLTSKDYYGGGTAGSVYLAALQQHGGYVLAPEEIAALPVVTQPSDLAAPACRVCGCTDEKPCAPPCRWVYDGWEHGDLCSTCEAGILAEA